MKPPPDAEEILTFWFTLNRSTDEEISRRYSNATRRAGAGELASWKKNLARHWR